MATQALPIAGRLFPGDGTDDGVRGVDASSAATVANVPMTWIVGALWGVTVLLAGAWGRSALGDLRDMTKSMQSVAKTLASLEARVLRLERDAPHYVTTSRFDDLRSQIGALSTKLDRLIEVQRGGS